MESRFQPNIIEDKWQEIWQNKNSFTAHASSNQKPFTIVIPPPNITGILHMGHGLNNTLQDIIIRWKRMTGFNALWVPGTDHAGIATQNVVERTLKKKNISRAQLGREAFVKEVWNHKDEYQKRIITQLKKIGSSCDFSRERFTMDNGLSRAVNKVFIDLYQKKLIYKGTYITNWCPGCGTALSDEEVEYHEKDSFLYHYLYPLENGGTIEIATTRPETMLGDTAVAVNPDDTRYKNIIGSNVLLPLTGRIIPVIADPSVDMEFGTGAVKITPAHDPNDFETGRRHKLPSINIFLPDGTMNDQVPQKYRGLDRFACRETVIADLKLLNLFVSAKPHKHQAGHCYRCDSVIEPYLSTQWFVSMKTLAQKALDGLKKNEYRFIPARWDKVYRNWMENIRDWCISRQIWWGHRIPVFYCPACSWQDGLDNSPAVCPQCGAPGIFQDEDVLDTWFSSWLWPFSTLGWPQKTDDLKTFYPTSVLITAYDIIFFWVARMIMAGYEFTGQAPFRDIYIHGLVRDKQGRKMSKSLGNGIDPIEAVNLYGADAFKFSIAYLASQGQDILMDLDSFKMGYKFANKIWNAARFILDGNIGSEVPQPDLSKTDEFDKWIYECFFRALETAGAALSEYRFNEAAGAVYEFLWNEYCDWYIEITKNKLYGENRPEKLLKAGVLLDILARSLSLLHPFMPFITEEINSLLPENFRISGGLAEANYPVRTADYKPEYACVQIVMNIIRGIRIMRGEFSIPPDKNIPVFIDTDRAGELGHKYEEIIKKLARASEIKFEKPQGRPEDYAVHISADFTVYAGLSGIIDPAKETARLLKDRDKCRRELEVCTGKLANEDFCRKARTEIIDRENTRKNCLVERLEKINSALRQLEKP